MMEGAVSKAIQRPIAFNYYNHRKFSATILRQSDRDISFLIVHKTTHFLDAIRPCRIVTVTVLLLKIFEIYEI